MERVGWTLVTLMVHWPSDCDTLTALTITHLRRTVAQASISLPEEFVASVRTHPPSCGSPGSLMVAITVLVVLIRGLTRLMMSDSPAMRHC